MAFFTTVDHFPLPYPSIGNGLPHFPVKGFVLLVVVEKLKVFSKGLFPGISGNLLKGRVDILDVSLCIGTTGSHVPYESLVELRATYMPDAVQAAFRSTPGLIPEEGSPPGSDIV